MPRYAGCNGELEARRGLDQVNAACPCVPPCTGHDVIKNANAVILQTSSFYYRPNDAFKRIIWAVEL